MLGNKSVIDLLNLPPVSLLAWIQQQFATIDCGQDWRDLAYGSSSRVDTDSRLTTDEFLALATIAVLIYDRLAEVCAMPSDRSTSRNDAMALRVVIINKFGPISGDPVRDAAVLEDWFFQRLNMPIEQAFSMSKNSLNLLSDDFLQISALKDRVRLMKSVRPQQVFRRKDELSRWYALLD